MATRLVMRVIKRVERGDSLNLRIAAMKSIGNFGNGWPGKISAVFPLSDPESREDTGFLFGIVVPEIVQFRYR
jgi:hypothetical protein